MGFKDTIKNALETIGGVSERQLLGQDNYSIEDAGSVRYTLGTPGGGITPTLEQVMSIPAYYQGVEFFAGAISSAEFKVARLSPIDQSLEFEPEHPVQALIDRPNPSISHTRLIRMIVTHLYYYGNFYAVIKRRPSGVPEELIPVLRPDRMRVQLKDGRVHYELQNNATIIEYEPNNLLHIFRHSINGIVGTNPIKQFTRVLGNQLALENYTAQTFNGKPLPTAIIFADAELSEQQVRDLYDGVNDLTHKGRNIAVAKGLSKVERLSMGPDESQFIQTTSLKNQQIATIFGVGSSLFNDPTHKTFNTLREEERALVSRTLNPLAQVIKSEFDMKLFPTGEYFVDIDLANVIQEQVTEFDRARIYQIAINAGYMTENEVREELGLQPLPETSSDNPEVVAENISDVEE